MAFQSHAGAIVPSTRAVPFFPMIWAGAGTQSASTSPMAGRIRSQRRETAGWKHPKMAPASSWVMFVRISVGTITTGLNRPIAARRPPMALH